MAEMTLSHEGAPESSLARWSDPTTRCPDPTSVGSQHMRRASPDLALQADLREGVAARSPGAYGSIRSAAGLPGRALDDLAEGTGVRHREVGEDLAVQPDVGRLQLMHQARVGRPVLAGGSVDARDPETAEVALAQLAMGVGIDPRLHHHLFRVGEEAGTRAVEALGFLQDA